MQFDRIEDANTALRELNDTTIDEQKITVDIANKKNMIFIKCKNEEKIDDLLKETFEPWGMVTYGEKVFSDNNQNFIVSVRMETEQKAKGFL